MFKAKKASEATKLFTPGRVTRVTNRAVGVLRGAGKVLIDDEK
jgi:hypothetical protein